MSVIRETQLNLRSDDRGSLVAVEGMVDLPFEIKRVYYIFGSKPASRRGCHAHYHLRQMAICLAGSCRFLMDDGDERVEHVLDRSTTGLLIEPMVWHEMDSFSPDCVLLLLASARYDRSDYIHHYDQFIELTHMKSRTLELVA
ncbi:MAG: dTDP-6-deoxy-3,4-keto-hexulose isomerase [Verrucomicrobia bacterium]|nr:dTDP-6-deoxy-3,4-keto-hexulose isomerase [Verrucomicrobiota bacterium]